MLTASCLPLLLSRACKNCLPVALPASSFPPRFERDLAAPRWRFRSLIVPFLLLAGFAISVRAAHAGYYQITSHTNGTESCTGDGDPDDGYLYNNGVNSGNYSVPYSYVGYDVYPDSSDKTSASFGSTFPWNEQPLTDTGSGSCNVTYTWKHDNANQTDADDPPVTVIVHQYGDVVVDVEGPDNDDAVTGSADNGLGATAVHTKYTYYRGTPLWKHEEWVSKSDKYTIQQGDSFTVECSPGFTFNEDGSYESQDCSLFYTVNLTPFVINLTGPAPEHKNYILTGQNVTASLDTGNYPVVAGSYQWSTSGFIFDYFNHSDGSTGAPVQGGEVPFSPSSYTNPTFKFYTKDDDLVTVYCTAQIQLPDATTLSVSTTSVDLRSIKPIASWTITSSQVRFDISPAIGPTSGVSWFGPFDLTEHNNGQDWDAKITIPYPFASNQADGCFCQLATPTRYWYPPAVAGPPYRYTIENNGVQGLDGGFPYHGNSSQWTLPDHGVSGDSPEQPVADNVRNVPVGQGNVVKTTASDSYDTWLLFMPASGGDGAQSWVPLQQYTWTWSGEADQSYDATNQLSNIWTLLNPMGATKMSEAHDTTTFPAWTFVHESPFGVVSDGEYIP